MDVKKILVFFATIFVFLSITTSAQSLISPANNSTVDVTTNNVMFAWQPKNLGTSGLYALDYYILRCDYFGVIRTNSTSYQSTLPIGNYSWTVTAVYSKTVSPYTTYTFPYDTWNFTVSILPPVAPKISSFSQSPNPLYNGGTGTVYVHLSQGTGDITYSWYLSYSPSNMTAYITPQGDNCQVNYYIGYNTKPTINLTCVVSNSAGTDVKSYSLNVAAYYPYTW